VTVINWRGGSRKYHSEMNSFCSGGFCGDAIKKISRGFQKGQCPDYLVYKVSRLLYYTLCSVMKLCLAMALCTVLEVGYY
jgi:hypothetical protein